MKLTQIMIDQKQELEEGLKGKRIINREAESHFKKTFDSKLIKVITGPRRCGKSVFAYMQLKDKKFAYLNFDDERIAGIDTNKVISSFYEVYGKNFNFIFLDEVQNLEKWELFVNRLHRAGFKIIITGSNSRMLSKELATHLTGRHLTIELFPFSFREYLDAVGFVEDIRSTKGMGIIKNELKNYIDMGGFPEIVVDRENPKIYLTELYRKIIERDIVNRYSITYKKTFREIALTLLSNPGRGISYNKIKNQFGLGSDHTVKNYLSYLEEAYLIFSLNKFSYKPSEVERSEKKIYVIDSGIISSLSLKFRDDYGHAYENIVAIELLRRKSFNPNMEIYYWRGLHDREVDFLVKDGLKINALIQVCYNAENLDTETRETRSLIEASKMTRCKNLIIITEDEDRKKEVKGKKIKYVPLWKWLLSENPV